ncbi:hypothetical protein [Lysinibacillus fusiformis]|uniref:hypothetical protein n=1 Tax=Lysinibacillus fusiformis TaxID=28031 RepID=UPI00263A918C|nr:hypothetical protein [Lysinibacillus fusiformis]MDC6267231.1 hypothetical protein [Lysinibacillus sphaericus]MDN4968335.1 hypothetical protein [Lysinibacillus fusiformis]MDN4968509.1 hypothetical protein [Lysinibacillus fusiformis]
MTLTKQNLKETFKGARTVGSSFVFVGIEAEGIKEVISIPKPSFDAKEHFYMNAYSDDLVHVMNSKVKITGLTHGDPEALYDLV